MMKKRIIGCLLAALMVFSVAPVMTNAAPHGAGLYHLTDRDEDAAARYTVLTLDVSGSMYGTPIQMMKIAANKFISSVLEASGDNYVAIVTFDTYVTIRSGFVGMDDIPSLHAIIDSLYDGSSTNTGGALQTAGSLLNAIEDDDGIVKNIVLMSDGMPNEGPDPFSVASSLMNQGIYIYSLGFFHSDSSGRSTMESLQNAGYYDVVNPDELEFTFGKIANSILRTTGDFTYASPIEQADKSSYDFSDTFFYDDRYLENSSYGAYNYHLASMSLCLELSAWGSNETGYADKSKNAQNLLKKIGYSGLAIDNWFLQKPEMDSIGVIAGCKDIRFGDDKYTIIALAVRGGGYEAEWASNFTLGSNGDHAGFAEARDNVLSFLREYVSHYDISGPVKIWLTGFSRAGATANLVGAALDDGFNLGNGVTLDPNDLFVYTFEAPKGTINVSAASSRYNNIKNRVNIDDVVPYVAPEQYKFRRYGKDYFNPDAATYSGYLSLERGMLGYYNAMQAVNGDVGKYVVPDFSRYTAGIKWAFIVPSYIVPYVDIQAETRGGTGQAHFQGVFLDETLKRVFRDVFISRQLYTTINEPGIRVLFGALSSGAMDVFFQKVNDHIADIITAYLVAEINPFGGSGVDAITSMLVDYLNESLRELNMTTLNAGNVTSIAVTVAQLIGGCIRAQLVDEIATILANLNSIGNAHYPELCFAWLKTQDVYYQGQFDDNPDDKDDRSDGFYRVIRINCPVDVEVYNSFGESVAQIIGNVPQDVEDSSIISVYTSSGEKLVYLPPDESYEIKITATGDDKMAYAVNEESAGSAAPSRIVIFRELSIKTGDVFIGRIPAYGSGDYLFGQDGTNINYQLEDPDGKNITPDTDIRGEEVSDSLYTVTVKASNPNLGYVTGSRTIYPGEYAKVNVIPLTDAPFKGWYEGNTLVSMDLEYKFTTMRDIELIAQFTSNDPTPTPTPKPSPGGGSGYIPTYPTNPASTSSVPTETITEEQMPESESSVASKFPALDKSGIMGYVSGYPDGTFGGNKNITRYEAAVLFYSIIIDNDKAGYVNEVSKFSDVPKDQWYSEAVGYLAAKGIVVGYPDGTFKGANLITRAEFATMVSKFEVYDDTGDMPFSDVHNEHWAANSIKNAYNKGWISGYPDGTFMPDKNITRAETVTIVNKLLGWTADISREYAVTFIDLADTDWFFIDVLLAANGLE